VEFAADEQGTDSCRVYYTNNGAVYVRTADGLGSGVSFATSASAIPLNQWTSIMVQRRVSGNSWNNRIYVNGVLLTDQTSSNAIVHRNRPVRHVGRSMIAGERDKHMDGSIFGLVFASTPS